MRERPAVPMLAGESIGRPRVDPRLHDVQALDEIELYADVLSAVAAVDRPLTSAELDEALGVGARAADLACRVGLPAPGEHHVGIPVREAE